MNIIQDFIPAGRRNRPGRANPMRWITVHNTGNRSPGAGARNHNAFIRGTAATNAPLSWHYTVDDREIFQHLPDNEDAFHAGDGAGAGNRQSIGIEICMNSDGDLLRATDNAVELTAMLCRRHNIPIESVVQHNRWNGKNCPSELRAGRPYNWDEFIRRVRAAVASPAPADPTEPPSMDELARQVIRGDWGNGAERTRRLTAAGHNAAAVQRRVNEILRGDSGSAPSAPTTPPRPSMDEIARQVIRGDWGNNPERARRLAAAGHNSAAIQRRVNEMLRS